MGVGFSHGGTVFQVVLRTAKLKPAAALQVLRQDREGLVFQAVGHLAAHID